MSLSRRDFLGSVAAGAATFTFVPSGVLGQGGQTPPSEKLNIAGVGVGGMGASNMDAVSSQNVVALCDVDDEKAAKTFNKFPGAKKYRDYRKMLDEMGKQIDAVIVATPDHTHAVIAMEAIRRGKHVYVQKPMTRTVYEARMLKQAAAEHKVITQMGNQGHSGPSIRKICEWIWDGAIGPVREVHAWTNRPIWPQGIDRPKDTPAVPQNLDWDLWLGPAPTRPYNPVYHPFSWRGWWDFGSGALGDMGCHILDAPFWALKLGSPISVQASVTKTNKASSSIAKETFPLSSIVHFKFPARGDMPPVTLTWYDGGLTPPRPEELEEGRKMGDDGSGSLFVGDKGKLIAGTYAGGPQLLPYSRMKEYKQPAETLPRVKTSHEMNWVEACKSGKPASCDFSYAGPFTEMVVLGNLAVRFPNTRLLWDGQAMQVTNLPEANAFVKQPFREGWSL